MKPRIRDLWVLCTNEAMSERKKSTSNAAKDVLMAKALTFLDVETPNRSNSKICSIGVVRTDANGNTEYERHFYVNLR